jgi:hypothetical protein
MDNKVWEQLLYLYDYHIRSVAETQGTSMDIDDVAYECGYADAIGQVILDFGKIYNQDILHDQFEAHKRVMNFTNAAKYVQDYPVPVERPEIHP